jgi:hypothetical protein
MAALLATPHADHEVHREQDDLEEDEEEDEVLGHEGPVHPHLEDEGQDEERLRVVRCGEVVPAVDDHHDGDEHRQQEQGEADAVDAELVAAADDVDPPLVDRELQDAPGLAVVELDEQVHAEAQ